jgi:hypothetical protein
MKKIVLILLWLQKIIDLTNSRITMCWPGPETRDHQREYEKQKQEDEKAKQQKKDEKTQ